MDRSDGESLLMSSKTSQLSDFVQELHGKGKCPHLLTLDNIFRIGKAAIEQVNKLNIQIVHILRGLWVLNVNKCKQFKVI